MKYKQWNLSPAPGVDALRRMELAGLPPLCAAVLCARGLDTPEKAAGFLTETPVLQRDPFLLRDMDRAVARIRRALTAGEIIAVYGDYDVDGITATCLLLEALQDLGGQAVPYIPDRTHEGYGLNTGAIDALAHSGVRLIVTVDCGITASREVAYAKGLGVDVVVTDHHQCKGELPGAAAVVDPRRPDCPYPFKELAGVGVALKLALALVPPERREDVLHRYGELAAIGTISDVMRLTDEKPGPGAPGAGPAEPHPAARPAGSVAGGGLRARPAAHRCHCGLRPGPPDQRRRPDGTGGCGPEPAAHPQ